MTTSNLIPANSLWLRKMYLTRAAFSIVWVALAFTAAQKSPSLAGVLLVIYPIWDALANLADARRSGGFTASPSQAINTVVSLVTAGAMAIAVSKGMSAVFVVFGAWATLSGLLQLVTAVRRWKHFGAQWAMALSGAQSAVGGVFFVLQANDPAPKLQALAGYAGVGALYFLISGSVLLYRERQADHLPVA
jgi:uncharacterized membrane protein HdeD (DUF308 family)